MIAWFRALHIRERHIARQHQVQADLHDRVHRLEMALREAKDRLDQQDELLERLRSRQNGARGGRPPKGASQEALPLDAIPAGDKAALRKHFGIVK